MVRLTIDKGLEVKLLRESEPLELCDGGGRVLGHFIPAPTAGGYQGVESPTPAPELDRRSRDETGRPLTDILRDLQERP